MPGAPGTALPCENHNDNDANPGGDPRMSRRSGFFFDERCFWHAAGLHALILPVGGWLQPPAGSGHAESAESKRRLKSLMDVSGLSAKLRLASAPLASEEDLLRVHPLDYLQRFKAMSDAGHGELGEEAMVGPGTYEIARQSAGLAIAAVDAVLSGERALLRPRGDRGTGRGGHRGGRPLPADARRPAAGRGFPRLPAPGYRAHGAEAGPVGRDQACGSVPGRR